jgi:hypothetical protein
VQIETALDLYGDALNSRTTPRLAGLLRACDALALRSPEAVLVPFRRDVPPVLTYVDKGLGASIFRTRLRLVDGGPLSAVAALKITRQNLYRPTALIHETGHQAAHVLGWNDELTRTIGHELASVWSGWSSEIAADTYAFAFTGYGAGCGAARRGPRYQPRSAWPLPARGPCDTARSPTSATRSARRRRARPRSPLGW